MRKGFKFLLFLQAKSCTQPASGYSSGSIGVPVAQCTGTGVGGTVEPGASLDEMGPGSNSMAAAVEQSELLTDTTNLLTDNTKMRMAGTDIITAMVKGNTSGEQVVNRQQRGTQALHTRTALQGNASSNTAAQPLLAYDQALLAFVGHFGLTVAQNSGVDTGILGSGLSAVRQQLICFLLQKKINRYVLGFVTPPKE